jgi:uncharacterized lipoprotein YmbA
MEAIMDIHKKRKPGALKTVLLLTAAAAALSACTKTQPSRFYVLISTLQQAPAAESAQTSAVGIRLVSIPKFMDRPQITERVGEHEIQLAEFDRWAGPIDKNIAQALGENLSVLLPGAQVVVFPWKQSQQPESQVEVVIRRFDGKAGNNVVLEADWSIRHADGTIRPASKTFTRKTANAEYASLVAAMSELLADLSQEIAAGLEAHP